ncbi:MAG: hypothetical protein Q9217_006290 [Psora testacea]
MPTVSSPLLLLLSLLTLGTTAQRIVSTIVKTAATSTIAISSSYTAASPQYTNPSDLQFAVLNSTNTYRQQHNATALTWNTTLASYAKTHVSSCQFAHSRGPYGENLAQGYPNIAAAIDAWGDERQHYNFGNGAFSKQTGHFTQLVWKSTSSTGCGVEECGEKGWLVFCEYWPPGNVMGEFGEEVQQMVKENEGPDSSPSENTPVQSALPKEGGVRGYVIYLQGKINGATRAPAERRFGLPMVIAIIIWLLL